MKKFETVDIRNVVLAGAGGAGKTSLAEAMLFAAGVTTRLGSTVEGTSVLDYDPDEVARTVSLQTSLASFDWKKKRLNLIDTPGFANFLADAYAGIRVADAAVFVISAVNGIKVETEKLWKQADLGNLARLLFISKVDKDRADFAKVLESLNKFSGNKAVPVLVPAGEGADFKGLIDLINQKLITAGTDGSWKTIGDIPSELADEAASWRDKLVDRVAETNDALLEKFLGGEALGTQEIQEALTAAVKARAVYPVFCGSGISMAGVAQILDAIFASLPSPLEMPAAEGLMPSSSEKTVRKPDETAPFSGLVYKTIADPYAGRLTVLRIYSGTLHADTTLYNSNKGSKEKFGQIFHLVGKTQTAANIAVAGDIVCLAKLKETATGDTVCDEKTPIRYDFVQLPKAAISFAITPKTQGDDEKMSQALHRLQEEDPTLQLGRDPQTHEMILSGLGQLHLEVILAKMKRKFGVDVVMHEPKIPYKETIKGRTKVQGRHKKQTGGRGQFGDCWLEIEPLPRGSGFEFVDRIVGGSIPRNYIPAVEKGILETMDIGPVAGYPVVDVRVSLYDGSFHTVDSSEMAFKIAGRKGFKKGILDSKPVLLEPIMTVIVQVPDEYMGDIIGDLNSRRGRVVGVEASATGQSIQAKVPMSEMLKYSNDLRSKTQGRGAFDMEFDHYEELPSELAKKIIDLAKKGQEEEEE